jgi:hypothetical protein
MTKMQRCRYEWLKCRDLSVHSRDAWKQVCIYVKDMNDLNAYIKLWVKCKDALLKCRDALLKGRDADMDD